MKGHLTDTHSKAEKFHIKLLREAPVYRLLAMANSLTKTAYWLSWQGICERYGNEPAEARLERFVTLLYGNEALAKDVIEAMRKKGLLAE
jgi:hypothetical protein